MTKFSQRIEEYCEKHDVDIPPGFYRRAASRYAIVVQAEESQTKKLVARTWFKVADVVHYIETCASDEPYRILDFRDLRILKRNGKSLVPQGDID